MSASGLTDPPAPAGAKSVRPKTLLERPWPWLILAGLLCGAVFALGASLLQGARDAGGDSGKAFLALALVGVIAVVLVVLVGFYSLRKRRRALQEHLPGTLMAWLQAHVWLGLAATFAVAVHVWLYPIDSSVTSGKIALAILLVLVLSGIAWRLVYASVPRRIPGTVGNLSRRDTRSRQEQIQVEIDKTVAGASTELRRLIELRLTRTVNPVELDRQATGLSPGDQAAWQDLRVLADRRDRYRDREPKQERYHRLLQGWKVLHLPLAIVLGVAIAIHVADVVGLTQRVFADEADALPASEQCAGCHVEVVREWMLAIHSSAQTTPTTVAQTAIALEQDPAIGQICTNCHAPLGTQIAPSDTFPLPGEGGEAVLSDGVTCWTCHALPEAPTELRGAEDDFPVNRAEGRSFGTVFSTPLEDEPPLPVPDHQVDVGFMGTGLGTFELCGACHNVKVDLSDPQDGFSPFGDDVSDRRVSEFRDAPPLDTDGNGTLDENELQFLDVDGDGLADLSPGSPERDVDGTNRLLDLVLQTTFDEWENLIASNQVSSPDTCGTCHMPALGPGPTVDDAPGGLAIPDRPRHSHEFIGVDYELTPGHYAALGVGQDDATEEVLSKRLALISSGVDVSAEVVSLDPQTLRARVRIASDVIGHEFPTGFAFARQWWLEVSAETADGTPVCLVPVNPVFGPDRRGGIASPCSSGSPPSGGDWSEQGRAAEDLPTCDPIEVAETFAADFALVGLAPNNATVELAVAAPLANCDPWLANFQKILTDGDPERIGRFAEVPYQSLLPDIVKLQTRVADNQLMAPLKPYDDPTTDADDRVKEFDYVFDVGRVRGQEVTVTVVMHLRHLPPYFLRALDGFYPDGLTADRLLGQMVVSSFGGTETEPVVVP